MPGGDDTVQEMNRGVLNVYVAVPRTLESDWISLLRQFGFLNAKCREMGIQLNAHKGSHTGFGWESVPLDAPCICISMMDEADYTEEERGRAVELLKREGVACVIGLLQSQSDGVALYGVGGSALHIIRYSAPSEIPIAELPAVSELLDRLASKPQEGGAGVGGRVSEIHPGLFAGYGPDLYDLARAKPDVIVSLDSLPGSIWEDFRGQILYYPIAPYDALPFFILERLTVEVAALLEDGKRVALFCGEDCGRVGYAAACVLFLRGVQEPIDHLRQNWNASALSAKAQEDSVRRFCYRHVARVYWHCVHLTRHIQIDGIDAFKGDADIQRAVQRIGEALGDRARILLRFSGLLPSVRVMVEAPDMDKCRKAIDDFIRVVDQKGHYLGIVDGW